VHERSHAAQAIAKRQLLETLLGPGLYLVVASALLLGYLLVREFVVAVDSSGFNYHLSAVYDLVGRILEGAFGRTFVEKLFAEGPFLFVFVVAMIPVCLFLVVSSVLRFGLEKSAGALELIAYGPADGTAYILAGLAKDLVLFAASFALLFVFMAIAALLNNLVLGPMVLFAIPTVFLLSISISAYGTFASTLTSNAASALVLFIAVMAIFLLVLLGSFALVAGLAKGLASVSAWTVSWISPLFYAKLCFQAVEAGQAGLFAAGLCALSLMTGMLVFVSHFVILARGIRG